MQNLHAILRRISINRSQSRQAWRYKAQRIKNKLNSCQNTQKRIPPDKNRAVCKCSLAAKGGEQILQHTTISSMQIWQYIKQRYHKRSIRHTSLTYCYPETVHTLFEFPVAYLQDCYKQISSERNIVVLSHLIHLNKLCVNRVEMEWYILKITLHYKGGALMSFSDKTL